MVVPAEVRVALSFEVGDVLDVRVERDEMTVRRTRPAKKGSFFDLIGPSPYKGPPKTIEEMNAGISAAMAKRMKRKLSLP
jgi:bifunctional DNA-binding transcriptional regulator/antitoxin component of YhaV-PrlF toxin-antitoxin module